jgi:hypothetical protein
MGWGGGPQTVVYLAIFPNPGLLVSLAWSPPPFLLLLVAVGLALRRRAVATARRLVADDRAAYDVLWASITAQPRAAEALESIRQAAARLEANCLRWPGGPRQHDPDQRRPSLAAALQWWELPCCEGGHMGGVGPGGPTRCLDQLYAQAVAAGPLLLGRVRAWALASGGGFPLLRELQGCAWMRWEEARDDPALFRLIRWGKCKSAARAVEKTVRSYNQVEPARYRAIISHVHIRRC